MDGPTLSARERRALARLEKSLLQDEQLVALLRVFEDPMPASAPRRRRVRVRVPDCTAISKWSALILSGAAMGLLVAALLTGAAAVEQAAICVTVLMLLVVGVFGYLRWLRPDARGAAQVPHRADPTQVQGRTRTGHDRGSDPDDPGPEPGRTR
ncbi:hypothetical protein [Embleya scabrispora]|uniref:hypothetical protein n=1 Tax=Embleya scabrispora TaxID=159449 RepID=UPI001319EBD5|nr:hypothetical protein [Embleya scabrispora]MYS84000.1 hypothetical protein [Streptomyces sp. SID5474]